MDLPASTACRGLSAQIAEQAVGDAVRALCRGGSWLGLARELGWRAVTDGGRDLRSLEALCTVADAKLGMMVDDAAWAAEQSAVRGWHEYLQAHPGDEKNAVVAATLDANEEAKRQIAVGYAQVLESLVAGGAAGQPDRRRLRLRHRKHQPPETLAA
jgi:hypothetical protein